MSKNRAAWILSPAKAFSISDAPAYEPKAGEVLIKAAAVAVVRESNDIIFSSRLSVTD